APSSRSLREPMHAVEFGPLDGVDAAGRPSNDNLIDGIGRAQAEVQPPLALRGEAAAPAHLLDLPPAVPGHLDARADRAAVARRALEVERNPPPARLDGIRVDQQGPLLVGHYDVENAAVRQVGKGHRAAVVRV